MPAFKIGTRVRNIKDNREGVVVFDPWACCTDEEIPVVYDNQEGFLGTLIGDLKDLGPENAVPEPDRCGAGRGADCCIFLVCGANGFECQRHGSMRYSLIFKTMTAKRSPTAPFPKCMTFEDKAIGAAE